VEGDEVNRVRFGVNVAPLHGVHPGQQSWAVWLRVKGDVLVDDPAEGGQVVVPLDIEVGWFFGDGRQPLVELFELADQVDTVTADRFQLGLYFLGAERARAGPELGWDATVG
jgi:hypothetical protein